MGVYNASWEDEENNRVIELSVEYELTGDQIELGDVTPMSVTFHDSHEHMSSRTLRVWTNGGRRVLSRAYFAKVGRQNLEQTVSESILAAH